MTKTRKIKRKVKRGEDYCSPGRKNKKTTCYDFKTLKKIARKYNRKNKKTPIKLSKNLETLWEDINEKLKKSCKSEWCWIKDSEDIEHTDFFKPKKPKSWKKKPRDWLDTNNIDDVLKQYEKEHSDFRFYRPEPIDFDLKDSKGRCVLSDLCDMKLKDLKKQGIRKIGFVFNLDPHDEPGSHWVALYVDMNKSHIYYFDSYGFMPEDEIRILINRFYDELKDMNSRCVIEINRKRKQFKNSECGVYCIYFIVNMLTQNISFSRFCKMKLNDDYIFSKRKEFFVN